jgi:thiol-disulfide isomerase/thioredoxin
MQSMSILPCRLLLVACVISMACGPHARSFPSGQRMVSRIQHDDFETLLTRYVSDKGDVDYESWQKSETDVSALDGYLGRLTAAPPTRRPELYAADHDKLSYWLNLYNALVLREVVRRWPLASVRDYQPTLTSKIDTTKGFFRDLRFVVGGKEMSLDDIEHETIRKEFEDARIHFALNCGSNSCPVLSAKAYRGSELEAELERATVNFLNTPEHVKVDAETRRIYLSKIFKWYGKDFAKHARRSTGNAKAGTLDFIALFAKPELAQSLKLARSQKYKTVYTDYDWALNQAKTPARPSSKSPGPSRKDYPADAMLPAIELPLLAGQTFSSSHGKPILISFWATYCAPCRQSLPHLQSIAEQHAGELQVLALSADDSQTKIEDFLQAQGLELEVAFGEEALALMGSLKVRALPTELFIDREGRIRFALSGAATHRQLDEAVAELLAY